MNSRSLLNIFLLLVLGGLISFFMLDNEAPVVSNKLTTLQPNDISRITIPREDRVDIILSKNSNSPNESEWYMLQPYAIKAHAFRVNTLLKLSQATTHKNYATNDLNLADYGLDTPRARIIFNDTEILFGKTNPLNNKRYLLCNNTLSLINDDTYPLVSAEPASLVDLHLLDSKNIQSIETADWHIFKNSSNHWDSNSQFSADQLQTLLENWQHAQAFAVHKYMPRKKLGNIVLTIDEQKMHFEISDDDPWLILARPDMGIEYHLDKALKNSLLGIPDA